MGKVGSLASVSERDALHFIWKYQGYEVHIHDMFAKGGRPLERGQD